MNDHLPEGDLSEKYDSGMSEEELNRLIEELCFSKAEEFALMGYDQVTGKDIWDCVSEQYKKSGFPKLHQIVNDILSLKAPRFMNWLTMKAYRLEEI